MSNRYSAQQAVSIDYLGKRDGIVQKTWKDILNEYTAKAGADARTANDVNKLVVDCLKEKANYLLHPHTVVCGDFGRNNPERQAKTARLVYKALKQTGCIDDFNAAGLGSIIDDIKHHGARLNKDEVLHVNAGSKANSIFVTLSNGCYPDDIDGTKAIDFSVKSGRPVAAYTDDAGVKQENVTMTQLIEKGADTYEVRQLAEFLCETFELDGKAATKEIGALTGKSNEHLAKAERIRKANLEPVEQHSFSITGSDAFGNPVTFSRNHERINVLNIEYDGSKYAVAMNCGKLTAATSNGFDNWYTGKKLDKIADLIALNGADIMAASTVITNRNGVEREHISEGMKNIVTTAEEMVWQNTPTPQTAQPALDPTELAFEGPEA